MLHVVTGGSGSGKSEYAERLILEAGERRRFYIATMEVYGEEGRQKVARHRKLREGKGFETVECPRELKKIRLDAESGFGLECSREREKAPVQDAERCRKERAALLECMSNLAANELFGPSDEADSLSAFQRIKDGLLHLMAQCDLLVVVTNEVFSDGIDYGPETNEYIRLLGGLNCWMTEQADAVTEVVYGIPVLVKQSRRLMDGKMQT